MTNPCFLYVRQEPGRVRRHVKFRGFKVTPADSTKTAKIQNSR